MSLSVHRAVEFVMGLALAVSPFLLAVTNLLDPRAAATLIAAALGIGLITLGIASTREGTALAPDGHAGLDRILCGLLLVAGVGLAALADERVIGALLVGAGVIEVALVLLTRYDAGRPDVTSGTTSTTS